MEVESREAMLSQHGVTPSAQLTGDLIKMCLLSQQQQQPSQAFERPPVPLFSQAELHPSQAPAAAPPDGLGFGGDVRCSQMDYLATPDYITPADQQFDVDCDPGNKDAKHVRSPAQLSPNRGKRARKLGDGAPGIQCHALVPLS